MLAVLRVKSRLLLMDLWGVFIKNSAEISNIAAFKAKTASIKMLITPINPARSTNCTCAMSIFISHQSQKGNGILI
jgi:hypothetical protein